MIAGLAVEDVSNALSLLCDESHAPASLWHDHRALAAAKVAPARVGGSGTDELGVLRETDRLRYDLNAASVTLDRRARSLNAERLRRVVAGLRSSSSSEPVQVAVDRWMRAKGGRTDLADRLIDMRIAFGSLFLPKDKVPGTSDPLRKS